MILIDENKGSGRMWSYMLPAYFSYNVTFVATVDIIILLSEEPNI